MISLLYACITYSSHLRVQKLQQTFLANKNSLKVKGTGPIYFNLGCYFGRDDDSSPHFEPRNHIETIDECHHSMFGSKFKLKILSTLEKGNHHDLDTSEFLNSDDIQKCQSTIGEIQWAVSSGSLDVNTEVMAIECFRYNPRQGDFDCVKIVVSYLAKFKWANIKNQD